MIHLTAGGTRLCDGLTRRGVLRIGGLGVVGSGFDLATLLAAEAGDPSASSGAGFGRAKSCILLFLMGGPPRAIAP